MRRLLLALILASTGLVAASARAETPHYRGPLFGNRAYSQPPATPSRTHVYRGWFGHYSKDMGPNYYGTAGFYGREYYGPGTGVYTRVPGGFGVYGY